MGEQWRGAAKGARDAVFLAVGTGIGAGIFAEGRIVHGSEDIAGAVGWFALDPAFKDEYAAMGCFEAEASGNSVGRKAARLLAEGRPSLMRELAGGDPAKVTAAIVAEAARKNDPVARTVINDTVAYLAMGIANIVSILNPEIIVLGGGLFQASDLLLEPIRTGIQAVGPAPLRPHGQDRALGARRRRRSLRLRKARLGHRTEVRETSV